MTEKIYFLCYPQGDKTKVTVIDLSVHVSYERDEWVNVNDLTFYSSEEAIAYGKDLCKRHNLTYVPFETRYALAKIEAPERECGDRF